MHYQLQNASGINDPLPHEGGVILQRSAVTKQEILNYKVPDFILFVSGVYGLHNMSCYVIELRSKCPTKSSCWAQFFGSTNRHGGGTKLCEAVIASASGEGKASICR